MKAETLLLLWGLLAVLAGGVVRSLKSDRIPINVPARWRPVLATAVALLGAGFAAAASGEVPAKDAILAGLGGGLTSVVGHLVFVEWLRRGRELFEVSDVATKAEAALDRVEMSKAEFDSLLKDAQKLGSQRMLHLLDQPDPAIEDKETPS